MNYACLLERLKCSDIGIGSLARLEVFLPGHHQQVRVGSGFSSFDTIAIVVLIGSILGSLSFNIFMNDLLCVSTMITELLS